MPYRIERPGHPAAELRRIAREQLERAAVDLQGEDLHEGIHQARRRGKKLRALLRLVRDPLGKQFDELSDRIRDAGRRLSGLRDATVLVETCEALHRRYTERAAGAFAIAAAALHDERGALVEEADARRVTDEVAATLQELAGGVDDWPLPGSLEGDDLFESLRDTYRRGRKAAKQARRGGTEEVHDWRKRSKDLDYQLRLLRGCWKPLLKAHIGELGELSTLLGDDHDLAVLHDVLDERDASLLGGPEAVQTMLVLIAERRAELLRRALALGERLWAEKPGAFIDRLASWWQVWLDDRRVR